jgi:hypothetical protein
MSFIKGLTLLHYRWNTLQFKIILNQVVRKETLHFKGLIRLCSCEMWWGVLGWIGTKSFERSSEMLAPTYHNIQRHIPEACNLMLATCGFNILCKKFVTICPFVCFRECIVYIFQHRIASKPPSSLLHTLISFQSCMPRRSPVYVLYITMYFVF